MVFVKEQRQGNWLISIGFIVILVYGCAPSETLRLATFPKELTGPIGVQIQVTHHKRDIVNTPYQELVAATVYEAVRQSLKKKNYSVLLLVNEPSSDKAGGIAESPSHCDYQLTIDLQQGKYAYHGWVMQCYLQSISGGKVLARSRRSTFFPTLTTISECRVWNDEDSARCKREKFCQFLANIVSEMLADFPSNEVYQK